MNTDFPKWVWALAGLLVVGIAYGTGTKTGALIVVITLLAMIGTAYKKGVISNV